MNVFSNANTVLEIIFLTQKEMCPSKLLFWTDILKNWSDINSHFKSNTLNFPRHSHESSRTSCQNILQNWPDILAFLIGQCPMTDRNFQHWNNTDCLECIVPSESPESVFFFTQILPNTPIWTTWTAKTVFDVCYLHSKHFPHTGLHCRLHCRCDSIQ